MEFFTGLLRGSLGIFFCLGVCYLLSNNRKAVNWRLVGLGMVLQIVLAISILKVPFIVDVFQYIANFFVVVLEFTDKGAEFIFGAWPNVAVIDEMTFPPDSAPVMKPFTIGYIFAFKVLPTIVFFAALSSLLYYLGVLQKIIKGFAWVMSKTMNLTGAESLAAAANVFIGQTEAPLVVKPFLEKMSKSEMLCLMTGGMATIAGGVFAAYIGFLGGGDPVAQKLFAKHLLAASIISAPAAIVAAKLLYPEENELTLDMQKLDIAPQDAGSNILDAISRGTTDGIKLAVNVGGMLLVFTAMIAMVNYILGDWFGSWTGLNALVDANFEQFSQFNLEFLLGIIFAPIAWLLGVDWADSMIVGQLLGIKTTINEFVGYAQLQGVKDGLSEKSLLIATYALCGFANFASIGIQIGGISAIAPSQRKNLTELGIKALIGGTIASFLTAAIAGILV